METVRNMDLSSMSLALSAILFAIGVTGVVIRRNAIIGAVLLAKRRV